MRDAGKWDLKRYFGLRFFLFNDEKYITCNGLHLPNGIPLGMPRLQNLIILNAIIIGYLFHVSESEFSGL
jgi:hypothetical protein